ncbi:MAG TPA: hypothetical protein VGJ33_12885 [Candidatus Angelobacter sp.]|jgi:hypothetical protein
MNAQMRKGYLRRYIIYRVKVIEFFDLSSMRQGLRVNDFTVPKPPFRTSEDYIAALRTVGLSWLALFVDKSKDAMDVIPLWKALFPKLEKDIDEAWTKMELVWNTIRAFRDKAGFHADKPLQFFRARSAIIAQQKEVTDALKEFEKLQKKILHSETDALPDLEATLDELLDELENGEERKYNRSEFKRYLIMPDTRGSHQ